MRARAGSVFSRRTSYATQKCDAQPFSLQYFVFCNEVRSVCSLKAAVECNCFSSAEVSAIMPDTSPDKDMEKSHLPQQTQLTNLEEMQFQFYLTEVQKLNPELKEGCLFVDGLYELISSRVSKKLTGTAPAQGCPRDLFTVHASEMLLLQKYWHRPDDPSEYSAYLTVAASFAEYILATCGPQGVRRFLCQMDSSMANPEEEEFSFEGRDITSLELKWKKYAEAQVNENFRLSTIGMVGVLFKQHLLTYWCLIIIIFAIVLADVALHLAFAIGSGRLVAYGHTFESPHHAYNTTSVFLHREAIVPLLQWMGVLLGTILIRFIIVMFSNILQAYIAVGVSKKLRQKLSARLHRVTPKFLDDHSASSIISTFVQDVGCVESVVSSGLRTVIWGGLMLLTCITYTLMMSWPLGLALTVIVVAGQVVVNSVSANLSHQGFAKSQATNKLSNLLKEQIDGFHVNKLYGLSGFWMHQINSYLCQQYTKKARKSFIVTKFNMMFQMLIPNIIGALLTFSFILLSQLDMLSFELGLSIFVFFTTTVIALTAATTIFPQFQAAAVSLGRINALLNCEAHTSLQKGYQQIELHPSYSDMDSHRPAALSVEFEDVCFSYSSTAGHWNLYNINLKVGAGERVAIVGSSGSGKSTLLHLIMKMYEPTHGSVVIGENPIHRDKSPQVAATFQFNHIFSMSIRENIRIGRLTATDKEVQEAAEQADLHAWIISLPRGYDTAVSSGGSSLSGGQKQRVAIARMLLSGAPVFVLDEVTSALDPATEERVFRNLMEVSVGKTVVAVTHRLDQAEEFDRIIVLSHGRIKEQGSHSELMAERGVYWQMRARRQSLEQDKAVPIIRRRGSVLSEVPPLTALHTVAERGETLIESTVNTTTNNTISVPEIRVIPTANCSPQLQVVDSSTLTIGSQPHPVQASTPEPQNGLSVSGTRIIVNFASISCYTQPSGSTESHSSHLQIEGSRARAGERQNMTVLYLDGSSREETTDTEPTLHQV